MQGVKLHHLAEATPVKGLLSLVNQSCKLSRLQQTSNRWIFFARCNHS